MSLLETKTIFWLQLFATGSGCFDSAHVGYVSLIQWTCISSFSGVCKTVMRYNNNILR